MVDKLMGQARTKYCADFTFDSVGEQVVLQGWVSKRRDFGGLVFVDLRDRTGKMQVVFDASKFLGDYKKVIALRNEYVVSVEGVVRKRDDESINEKLKTGYLEVLATNIKVLNESAPMPFSIDEDDNVNEALRLKYRYLDLRHETLQNNLILRSKVAQIVRNHLSDKNFIEVETPMLGKSTPEGARDYLVPSRTHLNNFFALPQSPQLYKQLLMIGGLDRYFQITKCFRDEDLRADRQPEFTQIDMEVSFVDQPKQIQEIVEPLIAEVFEKAIGVKLTLPFKTMSYDDAMNDYGNDKPDTRFDLKLKDISQLAKQSELKIFADAVNDGGSVRVLNAKQLDDKLSRRDLDAIALMAKEFGAKGLSWINMTDEGPKGALVKFFSDTQLESLFELVNAEQNDVLLFVSDKNNNIVLDVLSRVRMYLGEKFDLIDKNRYDILWVNDFPLFEYSADEKRYMAKHHPFTSPRDEDIEFVESNPAIVKAKAYDLVLNGYELGGGSIRIHNQETQKIMFKALGFTDEQIEEQFGFFVKAFSYGAPPHGGLAIGFDRLMMLLQKTTDIRSVIAFPKTQTAMDLMTMAPSNVSQKQLDELYLILKPKKED